ncbi:hypothetical protein CXF62_04225 [Psychrobacter sp. MES7-P7E]|nr:hypothetical protein CXF62_04225 [Psychrobacter sp. MES7-P7E]
MLLIKTIIIYIDNESQLLYYNRCTVYSYYFYKNYSYKKLVSGTRACPHFKNGDKNEINCRQTRKIVQIISRY